MLQKENIFRNKQTYKKYIIMWFSIIPIGLFIITTIIPYHIEDNYLIKEIDINQEQCYAYQIQVDNKNYVVNTKEDAVEVLEEVAKHYTKDNNCSIELQTESEEEYKVDIITKDKDNNDDINIINNIEVISSNNIIEPINNKDSLKEEEINTNIKDDINSIDIEKETEMPIDNIDNDITQIKEKVVETKEPIVETKNVSFNKDIKITKVEATDSILSKEDVISSIKGEIYIAKETDTVYSIAKNYNMSIKELIELNPKLTINSFIIEGEKINIKGVPIVSVITKKIEGNLLEVDEEPVTISCDTMYEDEKEIVDEGIKTTVATIKNVNYINGMKQKEEIATEEILEKGSPTIIKVGTKTRPEYLIPVENYFISSKFGSREDPIKNDTIEEYHYGVDLAVIVGTKVKASKEGTITHAGDNGDGGIVVEITADDGSRTRYCHLDEALVKVGDIVKQGDIIAYSGNTGKSTGPHLHFEIIINGQYVNPLDYAKE